MTDAPDLQALARRYLDLWQDQMAGLANDPALADGLAKSFAAMGDGMAALAQAAHRASATQDARTAPHDPSSSPPGAAAAGAASAQSGLDHAELESRVAALERRVAELEAALAARPGGRPRKRPA